MTRMGHASLRAALIYQHATPERDRALADALWCWPTPKRSGPGGACNRLARNLDREVQCSLNVPSPPSNVLPMERSKGKPAGQRGGDDGTRTHDPLLAKRGVNSPRASGAVFTGQFRRSRTPPYCPSGNHGGYHEVTDTGLSLRAASTPSLSLSVAGGSATKPPGDVTRLAGRLPRGKRRGEVNTTPA
jgi:hypothetical protein